MPQMYIAPVICLFAGIGSIVYILRVRKHGGRIPFICILFAILGIPAFIAYMLQIFGVIKVDAIARGLGSQYYMEYIQQQDQAVK